MNMQNIYKLRQFGSLGHSHKCILNLSKFLKEKGLLGSVLLPCAFLKIKRETWKV